MAAKRFPAATWWEIADTVEAGAAAAMVAASGRRGLVYEDCGPKLSLKASTRLGPQAILSFFFALKETIFDVLIALDSSEKKEYAWTENLALQKRSIHII